VAQEARLNHPQAFVARQPIFDRRGKVQAYELLFRSSFENCFQCDQPNVASSQVISNTFLTMGMDTVTSGKKAFVNFTRDLILNEVAFLFPRSQLVVEILEEVEPAEDVLQACRLLKDKGYVMALDDFVLSEAYLPFATLADIIKIDFRITDSEARSELIERLAEYSVSFLAEKVETHEEFEEARSLGCKYFQGYFFSRPKVISERDVPSSNRNYLQTLQALQRPNLSIDDLERIVKADVKLTYKLLRYLNSAAFAFVRRIDSIRHGLTLLGREQALRLISLVATAGLLENKAEELVVSSLVRANFCELLAEPLSLKNRRHELFLTGLLSMLDAILDQPMDKAVSTLPLSADVKDALLGKENDLARTLQAVAAYERGSWTDFAGRAERLAAPESGFPKLYLDALKTTSEILDNLM
jgi:EAL and modified HD-GYP domain-containing signal transduction protein